MIYCNSRHNPSCDARLNALWWDLYDNKQIDPKLMPTRWLTLADEQLDALLLETVSNGQEEVNPFQYALAADYIEENWDRLLSICETAAGVDPEPLLRRLLERLRTEWADCLNGVAK